MNLNNRKTKAFTMIELLVVVAIIGILSGLIIVSANGAINSANDGKRKSNISAISRAVLIYGTLNGGVYPIQTAQCDVGSNCSNLASALSELLPVLPADPNGTYYKYFSNSIGSNFTVSALLSGGQFALGPVQQCPVDWIDSGHGFCVMKWEARAGAVSTGVGLPQVSISQTDAIAACSALGNGSHLITNAEWTILARDIESVGSNWPGGVLKRGNVGDTAVGDYNGADPESGVTNALATLTLSNGETINHLSGNVWEWTNNTCTAGAGQGNWYNSGAYIEWDNANLSDYEKAIAGPAGNYTAANGAGRYYGCSANGNAFLRGGYWGETSHAGVFNLRLSPAPGDLGAHIGFRCAR